MARWFAQPPRTLGVTPLATGIASAHALALLHFERGSRLQGQQRQQRRSAIVHEWRRRQQIPPLTDQIQPQTDFDLIDPVRFFASLLGLSPESLSLGGNTADIFLGTSKTTKTN